MGDPGYPEGPNSLDSEETLRDKKASFAQGTKTAAAQLGDGAAGVALKNRILVRSAYLQNDPGKTVNETWRAACADAGDDFYGDKFILRWPDTGMVEA
jgi:hypothetical protein